MMEYIFKSALSLAMLYSLFFACLSRETFHRFNRVALLFTMLASLVLPFVHLSVSQPTAVQEAVQMPTRYLTELPVVQIHPTIIGEGTGEGLPLTWGQLLTYIYLAGVGAMLLFLLVQSFRMYLLIQGGLRHTDNRGNTVILKPSVRSPFSIFRWIVMSVDDYEQHRQSILTHEQEHIRLGHTYDLLLLEAMRIFQWFNPFVWFLSHDLRAIHEYEADEAVINQGIDAKQYQQLLVLKAMGNRLQPFANTLGRGSLKQRIIMMYQKKSNRWKMLKALLVIPTTGFALYAFAAPEVLPEMQAVLEKEVSVSSASINVSPATSEKFNENESITPDALTDFITRDMEMKDNDKEHAKDKNIPNRSAEDVTSVQDYVQAYHTALQAEAPDDNIPAKIADYRDGDAALRQHLMENMRYPQIAKQYDVSGLIILRFTVESDGTLTELESIHVKTKSSQNAISPEIMAQANKALVEEAIRVVGTTSGKWIPAEDKDGRKVRCTFNMPVIFQLPSISDKNVMTRERIKGTVYETGSSSKTLVGVVVSQIDKNGKVICSGITDANGVFEMPVGAPQNTLKFSLAGYNTTEHGIGQNMQIGLVPQK